MYADHGDVNVPVMPGVTTDADIYETLRRNGLDVERIWSTVRVLRDGPRVFTIEDAYRKGSTVGVPYAAIVRKNKVPNFPGFSFQEVKHYKAKQGAKRAQEVLEDIKEGVKMLREAEFPEDDKEFARARRAYDFYTLAHELELTAAVADAKAALVSAEARLRADPDNERKQMEYATADSRYGHLERQRAKSVAEPRVSVGGRRQARHATENSW